MCIVCLLLSGCTAYQYIPSHHYTTIHKQKGQLNASVNIFPAGLQAGYSITDHFFAFATAYSKKRNRKPYQSKEGGLYESFVGNSNELNLGIGYVKRIDKLVLEIMAGGGTGRMFYRHDVDTNIEYKFTLSTSKNNFFVEPLIGLAINDNVEVGAFSRINSVHFYHISTESTSMKMEAFDLAFLGKNEMDVVLLEPGVFLNAGWRNVKFNLQIGGTNELSGPEIRDRSILFRSGVTWTLVSGTKK